MVPVVTATLSAPRLAQLVGGVDTDRPAYQWLSESIRTLVMDGRVLHGTRLPSERTLVDALGLSRTTVTRAYAELRDRGYAVAKHGSGTIAVLPGGPAAGGAEPMPLRDLRPPTSDTIDLTYAAPAAVPGLVSAFTAAAEDVGRFVAGGGYYPVGIPELREAIATRYTRRGLPTSPDEIVVTTGALESAATAARVLVGNGSRVLAETPSYPNTLAALRSESARFVPVPITWSGSDVDAWEVAAKRTGARVALLTPDFHNPTGSLLEVADRERLGALWRRHAITGIIDETTAEIMLEDRPMPAPMASFAPSAISVGSVSKSMWGGLRIGWLRAPTNIVNALARARLTIGLGAPVLEQLVVATLLQSQSGIDQGRRDVLRAQRDTIVEALSEQLPQWRTTVPAGGLSVWWRLPSARSSALARAAADEGVLLTPGPTFAVEGTGLDSWMRTPFARPSQVLAQAAPRIARAWSRVA